MWSTAISRYFVIYIFFGPYMSYYDLCLMNMQRVTVPVSLKYSLFWHKINMKTCENLFVLWFFLVVVYYCNLTDH